MGIVKKRVRPKENKAEGPFVDTPEWSRLTGFPVRGTDQAVGGLQNEEDKRREQTDRQIYETLKARRAKAKKGKA
jgi:hypothetical protein